MEHETMKLKEQEEANGRELKEWKSQLQPRKHVCIIYSFVTMHCLYRSLIKSRRLSWAGQVAREEGVLSKF